MKTDTAVAEPKTKTAVKPLNVKTEEDIKRKLGIKGEKLSPADKKAIGDAARTASKALRKSNPALASHLYYVQYKYRKASSKKARK